jgi:hypothetical protein
MKIDNREQLHAFIDWLSQFKDNLSFAEMQLELLMKGVRDVRIHDNCIALFDAGIFDM